MEQQSTKKLIFLLVITVILLGLLGAFLLSIGKRSQVNSKYGKLPKLSIKSQTPLLSKTVEISFKSEVDVPKTAKVYKVKERYVGKEKALQMAKSLGYLQDPEIVKPKGGGSILYWHSDTGYLNIDEKTGKIDYKNTRALQTANPLNTFIPETEMRTKSEAFLRILGLDSRELTMDTKNVLYYEGSGDEFSLSEDKVKAKIAVFGFNLKLSNNLLMFGSPIQSAIQFTLTKNGEVFLFQYNLPHPIDEEAIYPLTPIEKISAALLKRFGSLVAPTGVNSLFDPDLIKKITIEDYSLVYLDDSKGEYIVPAYLLRGFATISNERVMIMVYLPAIEEEWLQ